MRAVLGIDTASRNPYFYTMDIARLSMDMATQKVQDQIGAKVLGLAMNVAEEQSVALSKLMDTSSLATVTDPALGSNINLFA